LNEIQVTQKAVQELNTRSQELRELLADVRSEVLINTSAVGGLNPKSNRKKIMTYGFLVPALCLFAVMIGFDMSSKSWRGESVAARLNLPILARYTPRQAGPALAPPEAEVGRGPNANECRALTLRLRQYVPEPGAVLLFSSLNEGNGVEELMADLVGYFALRDETVLLLDARIANAEADAIQRCVGRAVARRPVEVAPGSDSLTTAPGWRRGLVQYLVFEGQNPWDLAVPTRTPAVDYLPAGGPYPITDALASEAMRDLLESCRKKYSLILVVGPAVSKSIDTEILAAYINGLVLVLNEPLGAFTPQTRSFFQSLKEADVPLLGTVLCV
jgi:Mrp family chromosome partitioning ATPase